jgi:hypothetical protein
LLHHYREPAQELRELPLFARLGAEAAAVLLRPERRRKARRARHK